MDKFSLFAEIKVTNLSSWQPHATLSIQEDVSLLLIIFSVVCGFPFGKKKQRKKKQELNQNGMLFSPSYSYVIASPNLLYISCKKRKKISYDGRDFAKYSVKFSIGTKYTDAFQ